MEVPHDRRTQTVWGIQGVGIALGRSCSSPLEYTASRTNWAFTQRFGRLQGRQCGRRISECEAQIAAARRSYTSSVMDYNNSVEMFPSSLVAGLFGFAKRPEFEIAVAERESPDVRF